MLELQLKTSEILTIENHSQIIYIRSLIKQVQWIIKVSFTTYFFSFSNFKILHLLIKSFVIPIPNRVYSELKSHFFKSDSKNLKNLKNSKNLKIDLFQTMHTIIYISKLQCISLLRSVYTDRIFFVVAGFPCPLVQNIANGKTNESSKSMIYEICSNALSKSKDKIFHIQTIPNQWIKRKVKDTKFIHNLYLVQILVTLKKWL